MNKYITVRAAVSLALLSAAPAVFAQVPPDPIVNQNVDNLGTVTNYNSLTGVNPTINGSSDVYAGTSATLSVSASGAVGSVSVQAINSPLPIPSGGFGGITQGVTNEVGANVVNQSGIIDGGTVGGNLGTLGTGASASVSATGAVAAVSISAVTDGTNAGFGNTFDASAAFSGGVTQTGTNFANVTNGLGNGATTGGQILGFSTLGTGASASVSATGAVAAVSISAVTDPSVAGGGTILLPTVGTISQTATNSGGAILNTGANIVVGSLAEGASASAGATGAVASVSVSGINTNLSGGSFGGGITQSVNNSGTVTNTGANISAGTISPPPSGFGITPILGTGASLSASATGAVASVSYSNIGGTSGGLTYVGSTDQTVTNTGAVLNQGTISLAPPAGTVVAQTGAGASLSVGATGAVASVSASATGDTANGVTTIVAPGTSYGAITQTVTNSPSGGAFPISNTGVISAGSANFGAGGPLGGGDGASASVSATGAVGSVGFNFIDATFSGGGAGAVTTGNINQGEASTVQTPGSGTFITNTSNISNNGQISIGTLYGTGSSASIGASGAVGSVSYSSIGSAAGIQGAPTFGDVYQNVGNENVGGVVQNVGTIDVAGLNGTGSSASVSATGSVASFSISSVGDNAPIGATVVPLISQGSYNNAAISNNGNIVFAPAAVLGTGASASVAATGAVASASFRAVH
jgi:hypothetical protein